MSTPKIIAIDDSAEVLQTNQDVFTKLGCQVVTAGDAKSGFDAVKGNPDAKLVIIDFELPDKNGMELVEEICQTIDNPPAMVFLTTKSQNHLAERALELGVEAWILKPLKESIAARLVTKFVKVSA